MYTYIRMYIYCYINIIESDKCILMNVDTHKYTYVHAYFTLSLYYTSLASLIEINTL